MTASEVVAMGPLPNAGNLNVVVSVRLGGVTIHDSRIVQQLGQRLRRERGGA